MRSHRVEFVIIIGLAAVIGVLTQKHGQTQQKSLWGPTLRVVLAGNTTLTSGNPSTRVITFPNALPQVPICVANDMTAVEPIRVSPTMAQLTLYGAKNVTDAVSYVCFAQPN